MIYHILVVDDEPDIELLVSLKFRHRIRKGDYVFSFVGNGKEAYEHVLSDSNVDVVLTDINMPVMDGIELLQKLNVLEHPPRTVVVSACSDMSNIRMAMNSGAFDFLTKPINAQDLVVTVDRALAISEREKRDRELSKLAQIQLTQSEKMSSLGQMVAGIAHEINNPVNFIHGNLKPARLYVKDLIELISLYQEDYPNPTERIQEYIEEVDLDFIKDDLNKLLGSLSLGTTRIRELVLSLRNFSRHDEAESKVVDIHEGIDSTLIILSNRLKATSDRPAIKVIKNYGNLPTIDCHPSQLNQVVMNIVANAIDAIEESHKPASSETGDIPPNLIRITTEVVDDSWIRITISDNGPGIPPEVIVKLFDPFFTTKPVGKGTGIGLAISHQIITEKHNGKLSCSSEIGRGTTFTIDLPTIA